PVPPGPPTCLGVVADSETTTSLSISWTNPVFSGFSPIDGFTVNLTSRHLDIVRGIPGNATTMTANLDSLRPFTAYTIRLSVRNAVELEGEAAVTTGVTDSLILDKVRDLNAVAVNSTAIMVTWTEPVIEPETTAPVEMYRIMFSSPSRTETLTVPASETSVVLTGLDIGTDYSITVEGINSAGDGASDSEDVAADIDPPSVPQNFNGTSDNPFIIFVFWEQPETDGGRPIVRYDLTLTEIGGGPDGMREETVLANSNLEFTFSGLQQDTDYRLVLIAVNRDGSTGPERTSDPVEISITTLPVGPPQIPDPPAISMVTNTSARISWTDPGVYMCVVIVRRTHWRSDNMLDCGNETILRIPGITFESYNTTGLMPLTTYDARLLSVNFNGPSNFSDAVRFSTVGMVVIGGGDGAVDDTLETMSGDTVILTCSLDQVDNDPVTFTWARQDGRPLPEGSTQANGVLTIPGARVEDSGVYVCSASGVQGSFTLSVQHYSEQASSETLSTGGAVAIAFTITLLVSLPVGVVIGLLLPQAVRRCVGGVRRMKMREGEEDEGDIYEDPDRMATVIPLSQNEAYVCSQQKN
ncbi:Titin, partial [Geodia barretti]